MIFNMRPHCASEVKLMEIGLLKLIVWVNINYRS
jgi:hypothetical protein